MKKKLLSVLLSVSMVAIMLAGCGSADSKDAADDSVKETAESAVQEATDAVKETGKEHYTFGYTCMDGTNPFFVILEQTIRETVEANGDTLISTDPANDVSLQITQIEDMISQGIDAIFLNLISLFHGH